MVSIPTIKADHVSHWRLDGDTLTLTLCEVHAGQPVPVVEIALTRAAAAALSSDGGQAPRLPSPSGARPLNTPRSWR